MQINTYGYGLTEDGKTLEENDSEWTVLNRIRRLRTKGHTLQAIADRLNKEGIYTRLEGGDLNL